MIVKKTTKARIENKPKHVSIPSPFAWSVVDGEPRAISPLSLRLPSRGDGSESESVKADQSSAYSHLMIILELLWAIEDRARRYDKKSPINLMCPWMTAQLCRIAPELGERALSAGSRQALALAVSQGHAKGYSPLGFLFDRGYFTSSQPDLLTHLKADEGVFTETVPAALASMTSQMREMWQACDGCFDGAVCWETNEKNGLSLHLGLTVGDLKCLLRFYTTTVRPKTMH